jgi:Na+-driven multidrug efflux pump
VVVVGVGLWGVVGVHRLMGRLKLRTFSRDARRIAGVAVPAILTNVATPAANAYVTAAIAPFGDEAVAGFAIIGRVMPVAFGAIYALSGSIGPIIGQNYGIGDVNRLRQTVTWSLAVTAGFTLVAWLVLALSANALVALFNVSGQTAALLRLFCLGLAPFFAFLGFIFVANAVYNTLGRPHLATALNWARATIGTVPFVLLGAHFAGAEGVVAANMIGAVPFGLLAVAGCYRLTAQVANPKA